MRVQYMSDLHLEFGDFTPAPTDADVVVLAGDIHVKAHALKWAQKHFKVPVVYVVGNHEYYKNNLGRAPRKLKEAAQGRNIHVLDNEALVLNGVRILGTTLWTDFRLTGNQPLAEWDGMQTMSDYTEIRNRVYHRLKPLDLLQEHVKAREFLESELATPFEGPTIVVTHHAPSVLCLAPKYLQNPSHLNASYASHLDRLMGKESVDVWVHGHCHDSVDFEQYGTRVLCNPRGYVGHRINPKFDSSLTFEV
jgi:predicted phosphodiesterase